MWYLLLRPFDLAHVRTHLSFAAGAPEWADALAVALQVGLLLALVVGAVLVRGRLRAAVALAALAPAVFLLTNRIFSPQFVIVLFAAWAVAAALVVGTRARAARGRSRGRRSSARRTRSCTRSRCRTTRRRG